MIKWNESTLCLKNKHWSTVYVTYRCYSHCLHICNSCWATKHSHISRERRLEAGLPLFPLNRLDQSCFFSTNISASPTMHKHIEVITWSTSIPAYQASLVCLMTIIILFCLTRSLCLIFNSYFMEQCNKATQYSQIQHHCHQWYFAKISEIHLSVLPTF